jgi:hypothetical protein
VALLEKAALRGNVRAVELLLRRQADQEQPPVKLSKIDQLPARRARR